jgi:hypothetical protein
MSAEPKRKPYVPPPVRRISQEEAEEKLKKAADAGFRDAAEMLRAIRRKKQTGKSG